MSASNRMPGDAFMLLLDADPGRAAEKYSLLFDQLSRFFEWRGCSDPEELASETLARGYSKIVTEGATIFSAQPAGYFYGIARNVLKEDRRAGRRSPEPLTDASSQSGWRGLSPTEAHVCLSQCLDRLASDEAALFVGYYDGDRKALAREAGLSATALRVRVHRLKRRMVEWLELTRKQERQK